MSKPVQNHTDAQFPNYPYPPSHAEDEISLVDLAKIMVKRKLTIALVFAAVAISGFIFAMMQKAVFTASISLKPVSQVVLDQLNSTRLLELDRATFNTEFLQLLNSERLKLSLIASDAENMSLLLGDLGNRDQALKRLNSRLKVQLRDAKASATEAFARISLESTDADLARDVLSHYLDLAHVGVIDEYRQEFDFLKAGKLAVLSQDFSEKAEQVAQRRQLEVERLEAEHRLKVAKLQDQLAARQALVKERETAELAELEEALKIAESLSLQEPTTLARLAERGLSGRIEISADISNQANPLYLRGTRMLQAEIFTKRERAEDLFIDEKVRELQAELASLDVNREAELLASRESDLPFDQDLRLLAENIQQIETATFPVQVSLNLADSEAVITQVQSKRKLIMALALVLGLMLGVMSAFMHEFVVRVKENLHSGTSEEVEA